MTLNRAQIEQVVPHAGTMCLLDAVSDWDAAQITCTSAAPAAGHPLARKFGAGQAAVPAIAACEYAAQASAVHGALLDGAQAPRPGMLAKLMDVELHAPWFRPGGAAVTVHAQLVSRVATGCLYAFDVSVESPPAGGRLMAASGRSMIASGRLMIAFTEPSPA